MVAVLVLLLERFHDDAFELGGQVGPQVSWIGGIAGDDRDDQGVVVWSREREATRDALEEDHSHRIEVGPMIDSILVPHGLLWAHIGRSA